MRAHRRKKENRVGASGQLSTDVTASEMGLESVTSRAISDPDYIQELVNDITTFFLMSLYLKEAILSGDFEEVIPTRLEELLCALKSIMSNHHHLNSVDLQSAAQVLTAKMKAVNRIEFNEENKKDLFQEVCSSTEALALTLDRMVTNSLRNAAGHASSSPPAVSQYEHLEDIYVDTGHSFKEKGTLSPVQLYNELLKSTDSVELALSYAETWSKYTKDIVSWVEKKLTLELECARKTAKLAEATRANVGLQPVPLQTLLNGALVKDIENSQVIQQTIAALQANRFVQPLLGRKNEMDKRRKEIKELWKQEKRTMLELEKALHKAKLACMQCEEEYEKAKSSVFHAEEKHRCSPSGSVRKLHKQLEKKQRLAEKALQKVQAAHKLYSIFMTIIEERQNALRNSKRQILTQLGTLVFQCDLSLKAVTGSLFQVQHLRMASPASCVQSECDQAQLYNQDQDCSEFVKAANSKGEEKAGGNTEKQVTSADPSEAAMRLSDTRHEVKEDRGSDSEDLAGPSFVRPCTSGAFPEPERPGGSGQCPSLDSDSVSPAGFHRKLPQAPSSGAVASIEDLDETEPSCSAEAGPSSLAIFKNTSVSKAAVTHKFHKLRCPQKCRDCEGLVLGRGVKCEECSLVCHRKCLEHLVIICGHQKLPNKVHIFGAEFMQVQRREADGIPFILTLCVSEIEKRSLCVEGIYRVCGSKVKIEKLCQALENGMHLVDMSEFTSHDICGVLKLYLRELPEPFILFRLYDQFLDLMREIQLVNKAQETTKDNTEDPICPNVCVEIKGILQRSKELLRQLPASNFNCLHYLLAHLQRVVGHAKENKMNASNLGVIFGPSLVRPRPTSAPSTASSLAEYSNQALLVQFFITYSQKIFEGCPQPQDVTCSRGVDQGPLLQPLLPPEESESSDFEPTLSWEESEHKQNAPGERDACLTDNRACLLLDSDLESASPKMVDDSETCQPLNVKPKMMGNVNSGPFCESLTFEELTRKDIPTPVCSRWNDSDQQALQSTWAKQCEGSNLPAETPTEVPGSLQATGVAANMESSGEDASGGPLLGEPSTKPVRSAREASEARSSGSCPASPLRGPRTWQAQPWTTFYRPHAPTSSVRGSEEKLDSTTAAGPPCSAPTAQGQVTKSLPDSDDPSACAAQQSSPPQGNPEDHAVTDGTAVCPSLKGMQ